MEGEIDLRPYFMALLRAWKWLIGAAVLGAVLAYVVTARGRPLYEARAIVAVVEPRYTLEFDSRFQTTESFRSPPYRAYPALATSDEILLQLLAELQPAIAGLQTVGDLRRVLRADSPSDATLVQLTTQLPDPAEAARLVNTWAAVFARQANQVYSGRGADQVAFLENELSQAQVNVAAAEQALVALAAEDRSAIVANQLKVYTQTHAALLSEQQAMARLIQDIEAAHLQVGARSTADQVFLADQITLLQLQMRAFGAESAIPLTLQLGADETMEVTDQEAILADLQAAVAEMAAARQLDLATLEPQILAAQTQLQASAAEHKRLLQAQQVADETYLTLARELDEARIAIQDTYGHVQVASQAAVPDQPAARNWLVPSAAAAVAAFLLTGAAVLVSQWSKGLAAQRQAPGPAARTHG
ncbi:MAG: Wzz/FepE/Etk N-terminal domain-containing protein [Chloroflexota bacterium]